MEIFRINVFFFSVFLFFIVNKSFNSVFLTIRKPLKIWKPFFSAKTTWDFSGGRSQGPNSYNFNYVHEVAVAKTNDSDAS